MIRDHRVSGHVCFVIEDKVIIRDGRGWGLMVFVIRGKNVSDAHVITPEDRGWNSSFT